MVDQEKLNNSPENAEPIFEVSPEDEKRMRELEKAGDAELQKAANEARLGEPDRAEMARRIEELKAEIELGFKEFPKIEGIFDFLGVDVKNYPAVQKGSDGNGLYRGDFLSKNGDGFMYIRKGSYAGSHSALGTSIYENSQNRFPEHVGEYNSSNGEWHSVA